MADSKVTIKIDADAEGAKRAFADVQSSADAAMESGARSAQKLSKSLDGVAESATLSSKQIRAVAIGLAGVATGIAATALANSGHEVAAGYMKAGVGGAMGGLTQGLAFGGGKRGLIGAAAGGVEGLVNYYLQRQATAEAQKEGTADTAEGLAKAREEMDRAYERTNDFQKLLATLGDTAADAASRERLLADEIARRKDEEAEATDRMKAAEKAMNDLSASLSGPMTKEQEKYFAKLKDDWSDAAKDKQTARAELKNLENQKIEKARPNFDTAGTTGERFASLLSGLEKAGIGYAANGTNAIIEKGNNIAAQSLAVLESIDQKTSEAPTAVFA